jgi:large subunit ribosomal protein L25
MIKDVHIDPAKNTIMHVAFHAVNANDPVEAEVPVHIEGEVPAEKQGNFIVRQNDTVIVEALPANLPEFMVVDAALLVNPGDHITVADIKPIANVEILSEPELTLAVVEEPRAVEEPEETEVVDAADVPSANGGETATEEAK